MQVKETRGTQGEIGQVHKGIGKDTFDKGNRNGGRERDTGVLRVGPVVSEK